MLVQSILGKRQNDLAEINEYIAEITKVEEAGCAYWLHSAALPNGASAGTEADEARKTKAAELAARLRGAVAVTTVFDDRVRLLLGSGYEEYHRLDGKLFDIATGGKFEQSDQQADPERIISLCMVCHQLRFRLRSARTGRFSLSIVPRARRCWEWTVDTFFRP